MKKKIIIIFCLFMFTLTITVAGFALNRIDISGEYTCNFKDGRVGTMQIVQGPAFATGAGSGDLFTGVFYIDSPKWGPYKFAFPNTTTNRNPYEWGLGSTLTAWFFDSPQGEVYWMYVTIVSSNQLSGTFLKYDGNLLATFTAKK